MKKFAIPALALIMAVAFSAFTSQHKTRSKDSTQRYWYQVDRSTQVILANTGLYYYGFKEDVQTDCLDNGDNLDCLRGFDHPLNTTNDVYGRGDEQITYVP